MHFSLPLSCPAQAKAAMFKYENVRVRERYSCAVDPQTFRTLNAKDMKEQVLDIWLKLTISIFTCKRVSLWQSGIGTANIAHFAQTRFDSDKRKNIVFDEETFSGV